MAKKINYAAMFTLRSDGRYMGYWHELDREGNPTGKRHPIYDRDPEQLHRKIQEKERPPRRTLKDVADEWENIHRDEVTVRTWMNYAPHLADIVSLYGSMAVADITAFGKNELGLELLGVTESPIKGKDKGNVEYLAWWRKPAAGRS